MTSLRQGYGRQGSPTAAVIPPVEAERARCRPAFTWSGPVWEKWREQRGLCFYCGTLLDPRRSARNFELFAELARVFRAHTRDHFVPLCRGGPDHAYNVVLACLPCNAVKGGRLPTAAERARFDRLRRLGVLDAPRPPRDTALARAFRAAIARAAHDDADPRLCL